MQGVTDTLNQGMSSAKNKFDEITSYLKSNPKITAMLLAGGGAGLAGGALTASAPEREGETKGSRRMRILRNALLTAGAGAGTMGLGLHAVDSLKHALPAGSQHPAEQALTDWRTRGAAGGAAALVAGSRAGKKDTADMARQAENAIMQRAGTSKALNKDNVNTILGKGNQNIIDFYKANNVGPALAPKTPLNALIDSLGLSPSAVNKAQLSMPTNGTAAWNAHAAQHPVKHVAKNLTNKAIAGLGVNAPMLTKLKQILNATVGKTRAGQAARLAGGGAIMFPEILGGAKDFLGTITEGE